MCIGLDVYHNVLVWGQSKEGLLGLGYEITSVETPTLIPKLKEIKEVSLSEYHAVALNINGNAFSWGLGKYGELGLERSIYTPSPQQILTETVYSKVFCGNLITCFIDENGKLYYFGDALNSYLIEGGKYTVCSIVGGAYERMTSSQPPDPEPFFAKCASVIGDEKYKIWDTYKPDFVYLKIQECWNGIYENMTKKYFILNLIMNII